MRDVFKHRALGVAFIGMMLLGIWLVNAIFTQKFTQFDEVALNTDTAGLNLPDRADVKVRGEIIGQVTEGQVQLRGRRPHPRDPAGQDRRHPRQRDGGDPAQDALR